MRKLSPQASAIATSCRTKASTDHGTVATQLIGNNLRAVGSQLIGVDSMARATYSHAFVSHRSEERS